MVKLLRDESGAVGMFISITLIFSLLLSIILFHILSWEIALIRDEFTDVVSRSLTVNSNILDNQENFKKLLQNRLETIPKGYGMLSVLGNKENYKKELNEIFVSVTEEEDMVSTETLGGVQLTTKLVSVTADLKFPCPIIPLLSFSSLFEREGGREFIRLHFSERFWIY